MGGRSSAVFSHPSCPNGKTRHVSFKKEKVSPKALYIANWLVDSADDQGMPFMIIDKVHARAMIFDARGQLQGTAPALLCLARGDNFAPSIGQRKLSSIRPDERTTPACRFVTEPGCEWQEDATGRL